MNLVKSATSQVFETFAQVGIISHSDGGCGDGGTFAIIAAISITNRFRGSKFEMLEYAHGSGVPKTIKDGMHIAGESFCKKIDTQFCLPQVT